MPASWLQFHKPLLSILTTARFSIMEKFDSKDIVMPSASSEKSASTIISEHNALAPADEEAACQAPGTTTTILVSLKISKARGVAVIVTLASINFLNTMGSGILIAALPRIASDVGLLDGLILVRYDTPESLMASGRCQTC